MIANHETKLLCFNSGVDRLSACLHGCSRRTAIVLRTDQRAEYGDDRGAADVDGSVDPIGRTVVTGGEVLCGPLLLARNADDQLRQ